MPRPRFYSSLYAQVLAAIAAGVLFGVIAPGYAAAMKPLGDGFIKLIRLLIAPIVFTTVTLGIAQAGAMRQVGRIGLVTMVYFEITSIVALAIGLAVVTLVRPGAGVGFDPAAADLSSIAAYASQAERTGGIVDFLIGIVPDTFAGAFARGDVLQVLVLSILSGFALLRLKHAREGHPADASSDRDGLDVRTDAATAITGLLSKASEVLFAMVGLVMRLAPIGAFGAMAFTIGQYGIGSLTSLGVLIAAVYLACLAFIGVLAAVLGAIGIPPLKLLRFIREEIVIVLGTSSSESVLPRLMAKLEHLGCRRSVVGLVVPAGYSFNLDGTAIYMAMAAMFVAQASGVTLAPMQQLGMMALLMVTSKGAAAVTGSGFVTLAATLTAFPAVPVAGLTLLVGIDRFMSEARAITNLIGNAIGTLVVARWDGALDLARARQVLQSPSRTADMEVLEPEARVGPS